jgi:hypothetical protein
MPLLFLGVYVAAGLIGLHVMLNLNLRYHILGYILMVKPNIAVPND